jgi:hypothetical protein
MTKKTHTAVISLLILLSGCSIFSNSSQRAPDEQFLLINLKYGFKNQMSTFTKTLQKDLGVKGTITIPFTFTTKEQNRILAKMQSIGFYSLPDTLDYGVVAHPSPGEEFLRIKYHNFNKAIVWFEESRELNATNEKFFELLDLIIETIESKPEYKSLPEAAGG